MQLTLTLVPTRTLARFLLYHFTATGAVPIATTNERNTTMNKKMQKGFTLVEIMIVVAIIAILAAIAIPNFVKYRTESQQAACESTRASLVTAAENWASKPDNAAATSVDLATLAPPDGSGYFKKAPVCPDGGVYELTKNATSGAWECTCTKHAAAAEAGGGDGE